MSARRSATTGRGTARGTPPPLRGRRILVTRPRAQSRDLCERLRRLGARAVVVPTIGIVPPAPGGPLDRALRNVQRYDWVILTSINGARACLGRARALHIDLQAAPVRWAAIGPATAAALRTAGIGVDMIPSRYLTASIADELPDVAGRRVLLARTDAAPPALAAALRARGATVDEVDAYGTVLAPRPLPPQVERLINARAIDTVLFTSASTVQGLVRLLKDRGPLQAMTIACIGPVCAAAAVQAGLLPQIVAEEHTTDGLIKALLAAPWRGASHAQGRAAR